MGPTFTSQASAAGFTQASDEYDQRLIDLGIKDPAAYGLSLLNNIDVTQEIGFSKGTGAIKIQYFDVNGKATNFFRYRFLGSFAGNKYHQPPRSPVKAYLPPNKNFKRNLNDIARPLIITEGEFKALSGHLNGYDTIGLGGVDSLTNIFNDDRVLLAPLSHLPANKDVYICYDFDPSDRMLNGEPKEAVRRAELRLAAFLKIRGINVFFIRLGQGGSNIKIGLDDYLQSGERLEPLMAQALPYMPTKKDGENYLLSKWAVYEGDLIDLNNGDVLTRTKFAIQEQNCSNPVDPNVSGEDKVTPITKFLNSLDRTSVYGHVYEPSTLSRITDKSLVNLWKGFNTQPVKGDVGLWIDFVDLFFSDEPEIQLHFEQTMALMLQKPWVKQDRLPILRSDLTGIGKSFYFETFAAIINGSMKGAPVDHRPNHGLVTSAQNLDNNFNGVIANKSLVVFNEIGEKGERHTNLLKDLVTSHTITVNEKYMKPYTTKTYALYCITTNENYTHQLDATSRRELVYAIPGYSPLSTKLRDFWADSSELKSWINTPEARSALLYYYLNMELDGYDGTQVAPTGKSKLDMAEALENTMDHYIKNELLDLQYIVPKLEYELFIKNYPYEKYSPTFFARKIKQYGFVNGPWDVTRGQMHFSPTDTWPDKINLRPTVLINRAIFFNDKYNKDALLNFLIARYFKPKKF